MFFGLFRKTPAAVAEDAERLTLGPHGTVDSLATWRWRHGPLLDRAEAAGLDPGTILLLLQWFGPLVAALLERWLAKRPQ